MAAVAIVIILFIIALCIFGLISCKEVLELTADGLTTAYTIACVFILGFMFLFFSCTLIALTMGW